MIWLPVLRFLRKASLLAERERFRRELAEELATHEALKFHQLISEGLKPEQAAQQARLDMGNITLAVEETTDVRNFFSVEQFMQDVRHAIRLIRKNLGFSMVAIFSLALGIGGSTAVFSLLNALLIKPLPFGEPQDLVRITEFFPKALLVYFRQHCRTMDIASVSPGLEFNVTGQGPAFRITGSPVSANLFSVLRVPIKIGRSFGPDEDEPGRDNVVILSNQLWKQQFHSDPRVVGKMITINGTERSVVGVAPAGFAFPSAAVRLWIPAAIDPTLQLDYWAGEFTPLIGRLRPGASIAQARSEIKSLAAGVWHMFPWPMPRHWNANATVISLQTDLAGDSRGRLLMLFCIVGAVLVIACANVAGLLTARGLARSKELAIRAAVGAGRGRIVRQLLTESIVLGLTAGVVGLGLGATALHVFRAVIPPDVPGATRVGIDWNVAAFTAALSVAAGISFGTAPALSAARLNLLGVIKAGGQRAASKTSLAFRNLLVGGEIALTLVVLIGALLLLRNLHTLSDTNPGFKPQDVLTIKISPNPSFCANTSACIAFYDRVLNEARGVGRVADAALANTVPLEGMAPSLAVDLEDHPKTAEFPAPMFWAGAVSPSYLRVMGIPLLAGRSFTAADIANSEPVALVAASTARRFWPRQSAIGKHIKWASESRWRTVVGIVADVRQFNLTNRTPVGITGAMYMPYSQSIDMHGHIPYVMNLVVKTSSHAQKTAEELHRFAVSLDPNIPVSKVVQMDRLLDESVSSFRSTAWLFLCFASTALALAALGIYGLVSYSVSQSTYEIALRMAIGASGASIARMILARSLRVSLLGLSAGVIFALLVSRGLAVLLVDFAPTDPIVYASAFIFLLIVTIAATLVPAWRASVIEPVRVLRAE